MEAREPLDDEGVRVLARAADLPIPEDRLPLVAAQLGEWIESANELNRKMNAPEHQTVTPVTVFLAPSITTEIGE